MVENLTTAAVLAERAGEIAPLLQAKAAENEKLAQLSDETAAALRSVGVIRHFQPPEHGGFAGHPRDFVEGVIEIARADSAAGWVSGVVGVHPWEVTLLDPRVADEIWGEDPDTWIASPYTPTGILDPVDGGYVLNGRWQFSSGTDHAQWLFLGALKGNGQGQPALPPTPVHVVLPRSDYTIVPDSWDVVGLSGTGSKDIVVQDAFIPGYRTVEFAEVVSGAAAARAGRSESVYKLPFSVLFPVGITASVIGIVEGALALHAGYQRGRISAAGAALRDDPYVAYAAGEAASDVRASRIQLIDGISRLFDRVEAGKEVTFEERSVVRRDQVRAAWRAVSALDEIFARSGGNAVRRDNPLQRAWRDAHVGLNHFIHVPGSIYHANALVQYGVDVPVPLQLGI